MKTTYSLLLVFLIILSCCKTRPVNTKQDKPKHKNEEIKKVIDTSSVGILVLKKNKNLDDELLMLKNTAFCNCIGKEEYKILSESGNKYKLIPDNSVSGYIEFSNLEAEYFIQNKQLDKLIEQWGNKQYNAKPSDDNPSVKTYLINMKCLDFYNSDILNNYLDSIKQQKMKK